MPRHAAGPVTWIKDGRPLTRDDGASGAPLAGGASRAPSPLFPTRCSMSKDFPQMAKDLSGAIAVMRRGIPETMKAFSSLAAAATASGALETKTKELIAIAIAIALRCDGCIAFHVKAACRAGADRAEMLETIGMAIYMGGGPSMVYGAEALEAFDQFCGGPESAAA